jgi:APA family basic amino acid/polyamine antiporter
MPGPQVRGAAGGASGGERRLGLGSATALVIASMVGTGVFTTSGFALEALGRPEAVLLAWVAGGVLAACGALSYGALSRRLPESGGEYLFLSRTLHPAAGFLAGWISLLAGFTAPIAVAALAFHAYAAPSLGLAAMPPEWTATLVILVMALLHGVRLRMGLALQNAALALNLALAAGFIAFGLRAVAARGAGIPFELAALGEVELGAFAVTLIWVSFSYSGWNAAVYVAGEVRDPQRNLPRSLWLGTALVGILYLALNAVFLYAAEPAQLAGRAEIAAVAAEALGGPALRRLAALLVALALLTSISSMMMTGPRVYRRMASDGLFPALLAAGHDVPAAAVALQAVLGAIAVWSAGIAEILGYIGFALGLSAAATVAALFRLRHREGAARLPVPGYPWVPAIFLVGTLGASGFLVLRRPYEAAVGLLTLAAGLPVYALAARHRRADHRAG